mgnify:CR=1 FL=1
MQEHRRTRRIDNNVQPRPDSRYGVSKAYGESLGALYADTVSHLRPKVMVQGNPHYLGQAQVVSEVRAVLLAAVRSAVRRREKSRRLCTILAMRVPWAWITSTGRRKSSGSSRSASRSTSGCAAGCRPAPR